MPIDGQKVTRVNTLGSMYDQDSVAVWVDKKPYRMKASVIARLMSLAHFTEKKARKHTYLEIDWEATEDALRREGA